MPVQVEAHGPILVDLSRGARSAGVIVQFCAYGRNGR